MTKKRPSLIDRVKAAVEARPSRKTNWFDRLTDSEREELLAIKRSWQCGEISSSALALARDIVAQCGECGVKTCGVDGVRVWLSRD